MWHVLSCLVLSLYSMWIKMLHMHSHRPKFLHRHQILSGLLNCCVSLRVDGELFFHTGTLYSIILHNNNIAYTKTTIKHVLWLLYGYFICLLYWRFCGLVSLWFAGYNMVTKGCQTSIACVGAVACCEGNLCNGAIPTGPRVILLLVSSAIITLFLWGSIFSDTLFTTAEE